MAYHYTATLTLPASPLAPLSLDATRREWLQDARDALVSAPAGIPSVLTWSRGDDESESVRVEFDGRYSDATKRRYLARIARRLTMMLSAADDLPPVLTFSHRKEA